MSSRDTTSTESSLTLSDGHKIYTKTWSPSGSTALRANLIFIHGFSDHCNFYGILFPSLAAKGIRVYACDQRGWGRSVHAPHEKGLTGGTKQVLRDMDEFVAHVLHEQGPKESTETSAGAAVAPTFLMGHSMGGAQVLHYVASPAHAAQLAQIHGFLLESPFLALHEASRPSRLTVALGRFAGRLLPHRQMVNQLDPANLTRDPEVAKAFADDELCHDTGTLEGLAGMLDRGKELEDGSVQVKEGVGEGGKTRLWIGFGTGDLVVSEKACRAWFGKLQIEDKTYRAYEGWYHKLHAEPGEDKVLFAEDVANWVLERSGTAGQDEAKAKL